jgi:hypothetical protein
MSLTKVTHSMILGSVVDVLNYGAVGDGIADDTNAIKAAITAALALRQIGSGGRFGGTALGVSEGTAPTVFFPSGVYKITSTLSDDTANFLAYLNFVGEDSFLVFANGIIGFGGVGYMSTFQGLQFRGGATAISIKTNNADTSLIDISYCQFNDQTTASVATDSNSNSTLLTISNCKYVNYQSTGYLLYALTGDRMDVSKTWVYTAAPACFYVAGGQLSMYEMVGVPDGLINQTGGRWIDFTGDAQSLICYNSRFGGESAGAAIVFNYVTPQYAPPFFTKQIIFKDCDLFAGSADRADRGVVIAKSGLPGIVRIEGCRGPSDAFFINDQMTSGTLIDWLNTYEISSVGKGTLSIMINNTSTASATLSTSTALTKRLRPYLYLETDGTINTSYINRQLNLPYVDTLTIESQVVQGLSYPMTSTSGTIAIVDTGIYTNTTFMGFGGKAIYDVHISGNPNNAGSANYNVPLIGALIVGGGFIATPQTEIFYSDIYKPNFTATAEFTVTSVFWNGTTEVANITPGDTTYQIRIKVDGFVSSTGSQLVVRLTKRL